LFDVAIIGSGPAGYTAAIRGGEYKLKVALIEGAPVLGGTCLQVGCIPTKALLFNAEIWDHLKHAADYGIAGIGTPQLDWAAVQKRKNAIVTKHTKGLEFLMKKNKVTVIWGVASIDAPGKITVKKSGVEAPKGALGEGAYQAKHIILATGARPRVLPGLEPDKKLVWTYFEAMVPERMPK
jgi:dihydrolipoamide dehydrogenase